MKRVPVLSHVRVRAWTREPRFTFLDYPRPGQTAELLGVEEVCIRDGDGKVLARRSNPRAWFRGRRHWFKWDSLAFVYFAGYATWNYLVTPFLFLREDVECVEMEGVPAGSGYWSRFQVTFPKEIPTHCRTQIFCFDETRLLRRLDYTAEVVGRWARAAHLCDRYRDFDGLRIPTRRRVRPLLLGDRPLPRPTLVALDVHHVRAVEAASS